MKNETQNELIRKKYFEDKNLKLLASFLHYFDLSVIKNDPKMKEKILNLYTQVTGLLRNLAIDMQCT